MAKNWALVIGINGYNPLNFTSLKYAKRDAEAVKSYFEQMEFEVCCFTDDSAPITMPNGVAIPTQPTYGNLITFLQDRFAKPFLSIGDNCWFFFAGHGERHANKDYLMPMDANSRGNEVIAGLQVAQLRDWLTRSGADNVILLLDACRSEGSRGARGIEQIEQPGVITIASCNPTQKSWEVEELQHGVFTYALLEALQLPTERSCATVERLGKYLSDQVPSLCQRYGKPPQTPRISVDPLEKQHFILMPQSARPADIELMKIEGFRLAFENKLQLAEQMFVRANVAARGLDNQSLDALTEIRIRMRGMNLNLGVTKQPEAERASATVAESTLTEQLGGAGGDAGQKHTEAIAAFNVTISFEDNAGIITLSGEIDRDTVPAFREAVDNVAAAGKSRLVLQMSGLEYMSAAGLRVLIYAKQKLGAGNEIYVVAPQESVLESIEKTGFIDSYMVVDSYPPLNQNFTEDLNGIPLEMIYIPSGNFMMVSPEGVGNDDERPQHRVEVTEFHMAKTPITQDQYQAIMGKNPSRFKGGERPVEQVTWKNAVAFCQKLSETTGKLYRLPSEAEWEYACRAGTRTLFSFGNDESQLGSYGWYSGNSDNQTHPVGQKQPNAFGLYDMHGNVWEWCLDHWHKNYEGAPEDGSAWINENDNRSRLLRGGSWYSHPWGCRSASRYGIDADYRYDGLGFRVVCSAARTQA